jgi:ribosome biogenesis GTPase
LGWNPVLDPLLENFQPEQFARITAKYKNKFRAVTICGDELNCYLPGKLWNSTAEADLPVTGDWCIVGDRYVDESNEPGASVVQLIPRYSKISRMGAGPDVGEQILAANVDYVFVVTSVNKDFSVNRLHRYILLARSGNSQPVIVLSKTDLADADALGDAVEAVQNALPEVPFACVSSVAGNGIDQVRALICEGQTAVFVGSSGVGKSTLVNKLLSRHAQKTQDVRGTDDKGRHTTSGSDLFLLDTGGIIIDTAGLREVQVVGDADELDAMIPSVAEFALQCRFADCTHQDEPECAVLQALSDGRLSQDELANYKKLQRELAFARRKLDDRFQRMEHNKWKRISIENRRRNKAR